MSKTGCLLRDKKVKQHNISFAPEISKNIGKIARLEKRSFTKQVEYVLEQFIENYYAGKCNEVQESDCENSPISDRENS